jgi:hypothetical protein
MNVYGSALVEKYEIFGRNMNCASRQTAPQDLTVNSLKTFRAGRRNYYKNFKMIFINFPKYEGNVGIQKEVTKLDDGS